MTRSAPIAGALAALCLLAGSAPAQTPGAAPLGATYRILQNGTDIGVATTTVATDPEGRWVLTGSSYVGGPYRLTVRRFEARYDAGWRGLTATMDLATPVETLLVHTAVNHGNALTEITHDGRVDLGTQTLSADTLFIPDMVFPAYEALARRLARSRIGELVPVFVMPLSEIHVRLDGSDLQSIATANGPVNARRWTLAFLTRTRETPAQLWESGGRWLRLDMPTDGISVIRSDITP